MVNEEIAVDKLRHINEYTNDLKEMRGPSKDDYVDDIVMQRAVERTFMNLIQSCIELAQHIRASGDLAPSGTADDLGVEAHFKIFLLDEEGVSATQTSQFVRERLQRGRGEPSSPATQFLTNNSSK